MRGLLRPTEVGAEVFTAVVCKLFFKSSIMLSSSETHVALLWKEEREWVPDPSGGCPEAPLRPRWPLGTSDRSLGFLGAALGKPQFKGKRIVGQGVKGFFRVKNQFWC